LRHSWKFAAAILVVLAFQLRDVKSMVESPSPWVRVLCYLSLGVLAASLFLVFQGFQTRGHGHYPRGLKLWETLKPDNVTDGAAEEALVEMLLHTREQNARLNDAVGSALSRCGWLLFAGVLLVTGSQVLEAIADWT
jgi:hypothetical protein